MEGPCFGLRRRRRRIWPWYHVEHERRRDHHHHRHHRRSRACIACFTGRYDGILPFTEPRLSSPSISSYESQLACDGGNTRYNRTLCLLSREIRETPFRKIWCTSECWELFALCSSSTISPQNVYARARYKRFRFHLFQVSGLNNTPNH